MSLRDILTGTQFGVAASIDRDELAQYGDDAFLARKDRAATDLGREIMKAKGWREPRNIENSNVTVTDQNLYVFTINELRLFLDAKMKSKLIEMSRRKEVSPAIADALILLSERV